MIKIAVCDDDKEFRNILRDIISGYFYDRKFEYSIGDYSSGEELLSETVDVTQYQIIFLDINMDGMDGIRTAEKLRISCPNTFLVFVTAFINYTLDGYKVEAIRYVLKDNCHLKDNVHEALDVIISKMNRVTKYIEYKFNVGVRRVYPENIIYVESNLHKLIFHVNMDNENTYSIYKKLDDVESELSDNYICRIHKSYLVNMRYAKHLERYSIQMYNNIILPVAQKKYMAVKLCFSQVKGDI